MRLERFIILHTASIYVLKEKMFFNIEAIVQLALLAWLRGIVFQNVMLREKPVCVGSL
jgi:hypothetical protein